jgi:predicted MFS family arabinose efflux permease
MITMGVRQSQGLFVAPLSAQAGLDVGAISLALAIGQFVWGAVQPLSGALADRYGARPVLLGGVVLMALGCALTPLVGSIWGVTLALGILMSVGSGGASFSVLIGAASRSLPAQARGAASGIINAGGSFGQFLFAPVFQALLQTLGWVAAMGSLAVITLAALPLVGRLGGSSGAQAAAIEPAAPGELKRALRNAFSDRNYWLVHAGFFTCGFHIAFLITHLPGEVNLCGLPASVASWSLGIIGLANIAGSLLVGSAIARHRCKHLLALMYGSRAVLIALYLAAPRTEWTFYLFAAGLGLTWLATVPPTASLVGKLFGVSHLSTLFGMTLLSHQLGGFLGAWLGGLALTHWGDFGWMWYADMVLAVMAALSNLPIREAAPQPVPARA